MEQLLALLHHGAPVVTLAMLLRLINRRFIAIIIIISVRLDTTVR